MKDACKALPDICARVRTNGAVLLLDYDGTLVPIVKPGTPVSLEKDVRAVLTQCAKSFPVAVISGRTLKSLRWHVRISGISLAGEHGLHWRIGNKHSKARIPSRVRSALFAARKKITALAHDYPRVEVEEKRHMLSIHYARLRPHAEVIFRRAVRKVLTPYVRDKLLFIVDDKKSIDVRPGTEWHKGTCSTFLYECLRTKTRQIPVYIGDGVSDEDAFRAFPRGITIRVGKKANSGAQYCVRTQRDVLPFLAGLLACTKGAKTS